MYRQQFQTSQSGNYLRRCKGTVERVNALVALKMISPETCEEVVFHYNFLMHLRLTHQIQQVTGWEEADNWIVPKKMTEIEQTILKKVFLQINSYQDNLSVSFTGGQKGM